MLRLIIPNIRILAEGSTQVKDLARNTIDMRPLTETDEVGQTH